MRYVRNKIYLILHYYTNTCNFRSNSFFNFQFEYKFFAAESILKRD